MVSDKLLLPDNPSEKQIAVFFEKLGEIRSSYSSAQDFYNAYKEYFNCYAYAAGSTASGFIKFSQDNNLYNVKAIPGALSGKTMQIFTAEELHSAVVADGFEHVPPEEYGDPNSPELQKCGYTLVAGFVDRDRHKGLPMFHFAVRDENYNWSEKNGNSKIYTTNARPNDEHPLREPHLYPEDYLYGRYEFVGYYWRPNEGINVISYQMRP